MARLRGQTFHLLTLIGKAAIVTEGIDHAKNVITVYGVDASGKAVLVRPSIKRTSLLKQTAKLSLSLVGMEVCSVAHYRARVLARFGHLAGLIAQKFVVPYRPSAKKGEKYGPKLKPSIF